jgi:GNAT superfamily N-acetyltransferase
VILGVFLEERTEENTPMALSESALSELVVALTDRARGVDLVRELAQYPAQESIEVQATQMIGAGRYERSDERVTERNGHRTRTFSTKAGDLELAIPKLRKGSFFPSILEPRRRIGALLRRENEVMEVGVDIRRLRSDELVRVAEIDRTEQIDVLLVQEGERLFEREGSWDSPAWENVGDGPHSVGAKVRELHGYLDNGGIALGAVVDGRMVGIGVVVPRLRPGVAQLAFLHVSAPWRGNGVGSTLSHQLDDLARVAGASEMVVSATPSRNTVSFYRGRGFVPMEHPLDELALLEPDDIHMHKSL